MTRNMTPNPRTRPVATSLVAGAAALCITACSSRFFQVTPNGNGGARPAAAQADSSTAPVQRPAARPRGRGAVPPVTVAPTVTERVPTLPEAPEPAAVASDSAGVAKLRGLAMLWQTVRAFHPAVASRVSEWDGALVRSTPALRAAESPAAYTAAVSALLSILRDPMTRVESPEESRSASTALTDASMYSPVQARVAGDSTLVITLPTTGDYRAADSVVIAGAIARGPSRVILDLRAPNGRMNASNAVSARVNAFVQSSGLVEGLVATPLTLPGVRSRRFGAEPTTAMELQQLFAASNGPLARRSVANGEAQITTVAGAPVAARARRAPRIVVIANAATVVPNAVAALVLSGRASLVGDGTVSDESLVPSVQVPLAPGIGVRVRTGMLVYGDAPVAWRADTVLPAGDGADAPSMRAALALVRAETVARRAGHYASALPAFAPGIAALATDSTPYPYIGGRLLAGFRVWNAMRTVHAHRDSYDDDIDAAFERAIPRLESASNRGQYVAALNDLVASFDDSQVSLDGASQSDMLGSASLPFRVRMVEGRAIVSSVVASTDGAARTAGMPVVGTEITSIDGFPLTAWLLEHRRDVVASNEWTRGRDLMRRLVRGPESAVSLRMRDATGPERTLAIARTSAPAGGRVTERTTAAVAAPTPDISYVDLDRLDDANAEGANAERANADSVLAAARRHRSVILDLRGTVLVPELVLRHFANTPQRVVARVVYRPTGAPCVVPAFRDALRDCADERWSAPVTARADTSSAYRGRLVVLIDERTQGSAELLALALEATANATLLGSTSAGAAAPTQATVLPGGLALQLPVAELRRADGGQLHRIGLTPLVESRPTVRGVRAGTDEPLDRAVQWLQGATDGPRRRR